MKILNKIKNKVNKHYKIMNNKYWLFINIIRYKNYYNKLDKKLKLEINKLI